MDRNSASAALSKIEAAESRTWQAVIYGYSAIYLLIWGVLVIVGNVATQFILEGAGLVWPIIWVIGGAVCTIIGVRHVREAGGNNKIARQLAISVAAILVFGALLEWLFWPISPRQMNVYWPMIVMLCYILAGIWLGRFFIMCGLTVISLAVIGYLHAGSWLPLWMATANGGALILGGLYLRRVGLRL